MKNIILVVLLLIGFAGCAVKQKVELSYIAPESSPILDRYPKVNIIVNDKRPYVLSGEKPASYIGTYRGGFGNPFNVNTKDLVALSLLIQNDLTEELVALGFNQEKYSAKTVVVDILVWKFDAYQNAYFNYEFNIDLLDVEKTILVHTHVKNNVKIEGTAFGGGKAGVERDMPIIYSKIIQRLLRKNATLMDVLRP